MTETTTPSPGSAAEEYDLLGSTVRLGEAYPLDVPVASALQVLGPYRLLRRLGAGGMGIVFEAEDRDTGACFAVKVMRPTLAAEAEAKLRFFREARAMAAVGHQRIVPIVRVGEDRGVPFIVMPLLIGETLDGRLHREPAFTIAEVLRIGTEIAEGLDAAHQRGLIHRDVKPANVFLEGSSASVCLLDLGIARETTRDTLVTNSGLLVGTPAYMAPEQARGERPDPRGDLFSLGCILYQMTTGVRPFDAPNPFAVIHRLETHHPPRVCAINPDVPVLLSNLIMELLAKRPDDRPASAFQVMDRLRRMRADATVHCIPYCPPTFVELEPAEEIEPFVGTGLFVFSFLSLLAAATAVWYFTLR